MTIKFLYESNKISARAYNSLKYNKIYTLQELYDKVIEAGDINKLKLRNSGKRTILEYSGILKEFGEYLIHPQEAIIEEYEIIPNPFYFHEEIISLSLIEQEYLNTVINALFAKLSSRSSNYISSYLDYVVTFFKIYDSIFKSKTFDLKSLKNIGQRSIPELTSFLNQILNELKKILNQDIEVSKLLKFLIEYNCGITVSENEFLHVIKNDKINLFYLLNLTLQKCEDTRFLVCLNFNCEELTPKKTLEELAKELGVTRERARQLILKFNNDFDLYFGQFRRLIPFYKDYQFHNLDMLKIDNLAQKKLDIEENVNFSKSFYTLVIGKLNENHYTRLPKMKNEDDSSYFLIARELSLVFDFLRFQEEFNLLLEENINEDYKLDLDGFCLGYFIDSNLNYTYINRVNKVCTEIIFELFVPKVSLIGNELIFHRNTSILLKEIIEKALINLGKPSKVEDILIMSTLLFPNERISDSSIRSTLQREKKFFNFFGRSSTYGLVVWEKQNTSLKSGTIRDIAEEILSKSEMPLHIFEIWQYVRKYREDTTQDSISKNLQSDKERFNFLGLHFWGLPSKNYNNFKPKRSPKLLSKYIDNFLQLMVSFDREVLECDFIDYFCKKYEILPIQVQVVLEEKINKRILRRENDLLILC